MDKKITVAKDEDFEALLGGEESAGSGTVLRAASGSGWFKRKKKGILTETKDNADAPEGLRANAPIANTPAPFLN